MINSQEGEHVNKVFRVRTSQDVRTGGGWVGGQQREGSESAEEGGTCWTVSLQGRGDNTIISKLGWLLLLRGTAADVE